MDDGANELESRFLTANSANSNFFSELVNRAFRLSSSDIEYARRTTIKGHLRIECV